MGSDSQAVVLAAPERKRILRDLLAVPPPWSRTQRALYRDMLWAELLHQRGLEETRADEEMDLFTALIMHGYPEVEARQLAKAECNKPEEKTEGQRERERRREFRDAVTASEGAAAVTTGLVKRCIVCGGSLYRPGWKVGPMRIRGKRRRMDSAYCSNACRQAAYRRRGGKSR
jgi:hypothetical protein